MRHLQRFFSLVIMAVLLISAGCTWVGETAGRAKAGMENAISDTKSGYQKGYSEGKS